MFSMVWLEYFPHCLSIDSFRSFSRHYDRIRIVRPFEGGFPLLGSQSNWIPVRSSYKRPMTLVAKPMKTFLESLL